MAFGGFGNSGGFGQNNNNNTTSTGFGSTGGFGNTGSGKSFFFLAVKRIDMHLNVHRIAWLAS